MWLRTPRPGRAEPAVSREQIVRGAVALLDEEGAARLTMRRLAERLSTAAATLYLHVETKDDVLDLALDAIFSETVIPQTPAGDWRADVTALITGWRATMLRHPWSVTVLDRPLLGPNVLARTEYLHATLVAAGFTDPHLTAAAYALSNYVIGSATMQAAALDHDHPEDRRAADRHLHARRHLYPTLAAHGAPLANDWDTVFTHGLTYLLDGLTPYKSP
ncbi:TetR/AcrR family transcriptional regulator [Streptosporangium sp. KLBMP 9127]|nr:TetR/AcrR family transcriptional regulator [Streptosporangium sp. KLBMP 9127]